MRDTISKRINRLSLKSKLAWGYTLLFALLFAVSFIIIYISFIQYREETFYNRLEAKLNLLMEGDKADEDYLPRLNINMTGSLYDEEIVVSDSIGTVIFTNLKTPQYIHAKYIIDSLMGGSPELRRADGKHELLGIKFSENRKTLYGFIRAYDRFGRNKVVFLRNLLVSSFIGVVTILIILSTLLARYISAPITKLADSIEPITPGNLSVRISSFNESHEIAILADKFNELLEKLEGAFKFQHHFIQHISHELKTPLAIMIANIEGALNTDDSEKIKQVLIFQMNGLMEFSYMINAMLDISKTESQLQDVMVETIRVDELLFDCIDEVCYVNPGKQIDFEFDDTIKREELLIVRGNSRMLKMAFINLLKNAIYYSDISNPMVKIMTDDSGLTLEVVNDGATLAEQERLKMFMPLFRGANSSAKRGFGLGLVLVERIVALHRGTISYSVTADNKNCFILKLPFAN